MRTVVINNREGLEVAQMQPVGKNLSGQPILGPIVTLLPGANLVDSDKLGELLKNPAFKSKFDTAIPPSKAPEQNPEKVGKPILELLQVKGKDGAKPLVVEDELPLAKLVEDVAKKLISETLVPDILRQWHREEARPAIRYEVELQLTRIGESPAGPASIRV